MIDMNDIQEIIVVIDASIVVIWDIGQEIVQIMMEEIDVSIVVILDIWHEVVQQKDVVNLDIEDEDIQIMP
eukprot:CAMPEP_0114660968 /NCGR_PEP_ID=MMETSP0191-20121206/21369_1 /TAXON_ID=126664 /ORGANISM="Sorites sp." /LENGTH=70 /DNA_ID=CAMNT_0001891703 /DNA_START=343 /DNA_END=555 /DNA_ORIENTATION=+